MLIQILRVCVRVHASICMPFTYLMKVFFSPVFLSLFPSSWPSPPYIVCSCFLQRSSSLLTLTLFKLAPSPLPYEFCLLLLLPSFFLFLFGSCLRLIFQPASVAGLAKMLRCCVFKSASLSGPVTDQDGRLQPRRCELSLHSAPCLRLLSPPLIPFTLCLN